ncbi:hypothetical protein CC79DRAFT_1398743 [Sarocladium strictum]
MTDLPSFEVPPGAVAKVHIIDTTFRVANIPAKALMKPEIPGFETLPTVPTWSFLVESSDGRRALFDLGVPKDRQKSFSPALNARIPKVANVSVEREVSDTLTGHGVDLKDIGSIIWSHWHWDHIGDPSTFPHSTELVVGPGFKDNLLPAYPTNPDSFMLERHFYGRILREVNFEENSSLKIGNIPALDFFGDGSFYLLDLPGHATGHLGGLVRTSIEPDTFILMGGDVCHHPAGIRPSQWLPYPETPSVPLHVLHRWEMEVGTCPGAMDIAELNKSVGKSSREPTFSPAVFTNEQVAIDSVTKAQPADAHGNIFFTFAHDHTLEGIVDLFPLPANDWKQKGWKEAARWKFLDDLVPALAKVAEKK